MGISADASSRAFPSADVEAFFKRVYNDIPQDIYGAPSSDTNHVIIAVDPAGGGSSQFAIFSLCQLNNGTVMVRSASFLTVPLATSRTLQATTLQRSRESDSCA